MTKAERIRQNKIELARDLIESGTTLRKAAKAVGRSPSWVRQHAGDLIEARKRSRSHRAALLRLTPAPESYEPKPSCEMPKIHSETDVLDSLAWWRGRRA